MKQYSILKAFKTACLLLYSAACMAQNMSINSSLPQIIPASPEAAAIAKYINYPVDYSSGLVKIEIPLYELNTGDLTLPISLSYHMSGLKVNENSGWVGMGWTLNAEPVLSRSVKGRPDEEYYLKQRPSTSSQELYWKYMDALAKGVADEQSDEYYYKLPGKSGSFYFQKLEGTSYKTILFPTESVNIKYNLSNPNLFEIKDENGVYYRFGSDIDYLEYTKCINQGEEYVTNYKVSRMTSAKTGKELIFNYQSNEESYLVINDQLTVEDAVSHGRPTVNFIGCNYSVPFIKSNFGEYYVDNDGNLVSVWCEGATHLTSYNSYTIRERKIKSISHDNGIVWFDMKQDQLNQILIGNDTGDTIRMIKFFQSNYAYGSGKRKLDSLHISDGRNKVIERYIFAYNNEFMPPRTSKAIDHWGYHNGRSSNNTVTAVPYQKIQGQRFSDTPIQEIEFYIGGADREPDESSMQAGILKSITYPNGGKTYFDYEANRYIADGRLKIAGGLRIAKITDIDPISGQLITRSYRYGSSGNHAGRIRHQVSMDDYVYRYDKFVGDGMSRVRVYQSNAIPDLFHSGGTAVFYDEVTEYANNGHITVYKYNWIPANEYTQERSIDQPFILPGRVAFFHRNIISKEEFDQTGKCVHSTRYTYHTMDESYFLEFRKAYQTVFYSPAPYPDYRVQFLTATGSVRPGCVRPDSIITSTAGTIDAKKVTAVTKYRQYNAHKLPKMVETTVSNGREITDYYDYTSDVSTSPVINQLLADWRVGQIVRHRRVQEGKEILAQNNFGIFEGRVQVSSVETNTGHDHTNEVRVRYHHYDKKGNPVCVSYEGGPKIVYLWGYNYEYPIAMIENAALEEVLAALEMSYDTLAAGLYPNMNKVNGLRTVLKGALITTYTYKPMIGAVSVTDPAGRKTGYTYDTFQRLFQIKNESGMILNEHRYHFAE